MHSPRADLEGDPSQGGDAGALAPVLPDELLAQVVDFYGVHRVAPPGFETDTDAAPTGRSRGRAG